MTDTDSRSHREGKYTLLWLSVDEMEQLEGGDTIRYTNELEDYDLVVTVESSSEGGKKDERN